ncbi:MAG: bifunctional phosphoribosyl-AMP cyclohydrolase/phosphoribosyl-ATP diphosphatase HisIE [Bilifractor sp.]
MKENQIPCVYLKNGRAMQGFQGVRDGRQTGENLADMAVNFRDGGARALVVFDFSDGDREHDVNLDAMHVLTENAVVPVIGAGNVKRAEDVKKLIYAGCDKAVLNYSKEADIEMTEEVSKRFGKKRIAVYIPDVSVFESQKERIGEYVSAILCDRSIAGKIAGMTDIGVIAHDDAAQMCESLTYELGFRPLFSWQDLKTDANGLVPCVVQDVENDEVLMVAYMNGESFDATMKSGRMTYWSRSRNELWEKGDTSGHFQFVREMKIDCDKDTILAKVVQIGAACHTGNRSCFYRSLIDADASKQNLTAVLEDVYGVIADRRVHPKEGSYTNYLFDKGIDKILKKVGEESAEIIIAAKNPDARESVYEISDFLYHLMVLMVEKGITWKDIAKELANR